MAKLQYGKTKRERVDAAEAAAHDDANLFDTLLDRFTNVAERRTPDGTDYQIDLHTLPRRYGKDRIIGYYLWLAKPAAVPLRLVRQSAFDTLMVRTGISGERQFGEADFDDLVFVDCDDTMLVEQFLGHRRQREACLELFRAGCSEIYLDEYGLKAALPNAWSEPRRQGVEAEDRLEAQITAQVKWLAQLAEGLPARAPKRAAGGRRPAALVVLASFFILLGYVSMSDSLVTGNAVPMLDIRWRFLPVPLGMTLLFCIGYVWRHRGRVAPHRRVIPWAAGVFSAGLLLLPILASVNRDSANPSHWGAVVVGAQEASNRYGVTYKVEVTDLLQSGRTYWIEVSEADFRRAERPGHACLHFDLYPGRLGVPYYDHLRVEEASAATPCPLGGGGSAAR